jgi:peptidoglycan/xylan/chitin deacetylase (PgdA/CDA1 family)
MIRAALSWISGQALAGMLRLFAPLFPSQIPVLTYHSVDNSGSLLSVAPAVLRQHLTELRDAGWRSLSIAEYRAFAAGAKPPEHRILITFDDGYANFFHNALPLLVELRSKATVFVCPDWVGREPRWMRRDAELVRGLSRRLGFTAALHTRLEQEMDRLNQQPLMDWAQLRGVVDVGIDVQSHAAAHHFLTMLTDAELADDLARSRRVLEEQLATTVRTIAYPYGDCDMRVAQAAAAAGYDVGFVTDDWVAPGGALMRSRTGISGELNRAGLRLLLTGWPLYPHWRGFAHRALRWRPTAGAR